MAVFEFLTHLIGAELVGGTVKQARHAKLLRYKISQRAHSMRISFAALLRFADGDKYLLVRNLHRNESFGPFGGVIEFHPNAQTMLDSCEFREHRTANTSDMDSDLRGFIPAKNLSRIVRWFESDSDRENSIDCVRRELREELSEISCQVSPPLWEKTRITKIRTVYEGPRQAPGQDYIQFRIFDIYQLDTTAEDTKRFVDELSEFSQSSTDLMWASSSDIREGRKSGVSGVIGHQSEYLFGSKSSRQDLPALNS